MAATARMMEATVSSAPIRFALVAALMAGLGATGPAAAQSAPFDREWTLQPEASTLRFQSVKNTSVVESSAFATFVGRIGTDGEAELRVLLDSVDTGIDLRNVRMRFLFFETFKFPEAVVTTRIDPEMIADLPQVRRKSITLPFTITLHGVTQERTADVVVTLLSDDMVAVSSGTPISLLTKDFGLDEGVRKLEEAANVSIIPSGTVTFDFMFSRAPVTGGEQVAATPAEPAAPAPVAAPTPAPIPVPQPTTVALETEVFDTEACVGRFEILSRSGNINFNVGSARLDMRNSPLLDSIVDIVNRCPGMTIQVAGHTDSDGAAEMNQRLSEARARSVSDYLISQGIPAERVVSVGHGEMQPIAPNDTAANKLRNRRIEFAVIDG